MTSFYDENDIEHQLDYDITIVSPDLSWSNYDNFAGIKWCEEIIENEDHWNEYWMAGTAENGYLTFEFYKKEDLIAFKLKFA